jgi:hypothetical protein
VVGENRHAQLFLRVFHGFVSLRTGGTFETYLGTGGTSKPEPFREAAKGMPRRVPLC